MSRIANIRDEAVPIRGPDDRFEELVEMIGDARLVLLGEATHGTHEFYAARAQITRRLIEEKDFTAVIAEADWPDAYRVNRYVRGGDEDADAVEALGDFQRFPAWMWRNADVLDFVGYLREHNDGQRSDAGKCGFYGMDVYSLRASMEAVVRYLQQIDPEAARRARDRYGCFDHYGEDPQSYGYAASFDLDASCREQVIEQLTDLRRKAQEYLSRDGRLMEDEQFFAEQNARVVRNAEAYYRSMFAGRVSSWNLRDTHMVDTLQGLLSHLDRRGGSTRAVLWAHNSHLGDARATDMGSQGELNVGQLVRERFPGQSFIVGFTTHSGSVTAADDWGGPALRKAVRPAMADSYELLFHEAGIPDFLLDLRQRSDAVEGVRRSRLERAIGVIYRPQSERVSHYFHASMPLQFDAVIHFDHSRAVEPLERTAKWSRGELPETYPFTV